MRLIPLSKQHIAAQKGVSAIFIVIFAALLLSLVAVSFIGLMIREQGRSADDEQSQGAYDAAMAGVEDGKRVLIECMQGGNSDACDAVDAQECDTVQSANIGFASGTDEVTVESGGTDLNMAYTCVVITEEDYKGSISSGTSGGGDAQLIIPLQRENGADIDRVKLRWFNSGDVEDNAVTLSDGSSLPQLETGWPKSQPPIIRAQIIQYEEGSLSAADFDELPYAATLYLMPVDPGLAATSTSSVDFAVFDVRRSGSIEPQNIACDDDATNIASGAYACEVDLMLPAAGMNNRVAYLRLSSFYNNTNVQVIMKNGSTDADEVNFSGVQPKIDATGRANDLFRRVEARVEFGSKFPYPRAAVDITRNFCKTLIVGKNATDLGSCDPEAP